MELVKHIYTFSKIMAIPCPPPIQSVANPYFTLYGSCSINNISCHLYSTSLLAFKGVRRHKNTKKEKCPFGCLTPLVYCSTNIRTVPMFYTLAKSTSNFVPQALKASHVFGLRGNSSCHGRGSKIPSSGISTSKSVNNSITF